MKINGYNIKTLDVFDDTSCCSVMTLGACRDDDPFGVSYFPEDGDVYDVESQACTVCRTCWVKSRGGNRRLPEGTWYRVVDPRDRR